LIKSPHPEPVNSSCLGLKFLVTLFFISLLTNARCQAWERLDDFPAAQRDDGLAFVIGNNAYCGTGLQAGWTETRDFHAFNMSTKQWTRISSLPSGEERQYASGFASSERGFVFGGVNAGTFLNDLWEYYPGSNTWLEKSSLPFLGRSGAASFVIDNIAYIVGGKTLLSPASNEVWAYDISNDSWQQKNNLPFSGRFRASAAAENNKGYFLFGKDENNQFYNELYQYDPLLDSWIRVGQFPDAGRSHSSLIALSRHLIVFSGIDSASHYYHDTWTFNLKESVWTQIDSLPSLGRKGGICFSNGTDFFYSTGINQENLRLKETWQCIKPIKSSATKEIFAFAYPNATADKFILELPDFRASEIYYLTISNNFGEIVIKDLITKRETPIDLTLLARGLYFISIQKGENFLVRKVIKH